MNGQFKRFSVPFFAIASGFLLAVVVMVSAPLLASTPNFAVPDDTALRIRKDDTLTSHPSGENVEVEVAIESGGCDRKMIEHTAIGAGAGALLGGIFGGGRGPGSGRSSAAAAVWGPLHSMDIRRSRSAVARIDDSHYEQITKSWEKVRLACRIQQM